MKLKNLMIRQGALDEVDATAFAKAVAPLGLEVVITGDGPALRRRPPPLSERAALVPHASYSGGPISDGGMDPR